MRAKSYEVALETLALSYIQSIGGVSNIEEVEACSTRLRVVLKDKLRINTEKIKDLGAKGILERGPKEIHIVIGIEAAEIADEMIIIMDSKS